MTSEEALQRAMAKAVAEVLQDKAKLGCGDVRRLTREVTDQPMLRLDPAGTTIPTQRHGCDIHRPFADPGPAND